MPALTTDVRTTDALGEEDTAAAWELYRSAFSRLEVLAAQRHLMTEGEFGQVAADARVRKLLAHCPDSGRLCGIASVTTDLAAMPLVSEPYFARRWPEEHAHRRIHYVGFVGVERRYRGSSGAFAALVAEICRPAVAEGGVVAVDVCRHNEDLGLPRAIGTLLAELGSTRALRLDEQVYWAHEFPVPHRG
ncbi:hypothetical protein [Kineococcus xinjiangensis]|uniref:hypothetical protein n=1 Tax=Kineococcus xinjiangensis TaxID=512762 RepID=UPI000CEC66B1|nr:hypothetical protein [Kineococcus xinjiangensis]